MLKFTRTILCLDFVDFVNIYKHLLLFLSIKFT